VWGWGGGALQMQLAAYMHKLRGQREQT